MGAAILNFMTRYGCRYCYSLEVLLCETIALMRDDVMISLVTSKRGLVVMFRGEFEKKYRRDRTWL